MDRILYMDVDIVVDKNIYDDFYCLDFEDNYLIATSHNPNPDYCNMLTPDIVNLESAAKGEYFNSGVLVMNLEMFRKNITLDDYNRAYAACEKARALLQGEHGVGRVIARPFLDKDGEFYRTGNRHDYSLLPPSETMLDRISENGSDVISVGKIVDIFCGKGITRSIKTKNNSEGMAALSKLQSEDWSGLCFANLVDFDMVYGHRNDIDGYANALSEFDEWLALFLTDMREDDTLIITADHGCDPATPSTDHSREYVPLLVFGDVKSGVDLGVRNGFGDVAATVCELLGISGDGFGESFCELIKNND
jgi:phosphopentomutase